MKKRGFSKDNVDKLIKYEIKKKVKDVKADIKEVKSTDTKNNK